ncbi:MAG: hypothetical protein CMM94_02480 [Rickettsiales bacterium]|nr:hypothetical protein [Rickettsiales bacterium]
MVSRMLKIRTKPSLYRDFALLSAFILFILVLVSVWVVYETYQDHTKTVLKQLENESIRIDRALIVEIENASYLLESIGRQISNQGTDNLEQINELFTSFDKQEYPKNSIFSWISSDQRLVLSSNKGMIEKPVDVSDRDYLKKALADPWSVQIGRPILGRVSEEWVIPLAMGLADDQGNYLGAVLISLDINTLTREISKVIKQNGISYAITNTSFTLLTQVSDSQNFFTRNFDVKELAALDFNETPSGIYSTASLFGEDNIYSYYEMSSRYPYVILIGYDQNLNDSAIQNILMPRLFQLVVIAVFLLFVLWSVRRRIIQPVVNLTDGTSEIVRGEKFNLLPQGGPIEIEMLAQEIQRLGQYIYESKRIEEELRQKNSHLNAIRESAQHTNQVKAEFLESVSHELMAPINAILENAQALRDQHFGPLDAKYSENADAIYSQSAHIMHIINDIRAISEAESGIVALNESDVDVPFILQKCVRLFNEKLGHREIQVSLHLPEEPPKLRADELRLKQIFLNIFTSASNQLNPGSDIQVSVSHDNGLHFTIEYTLPDPMEDENYMQPSNSFTGTPFAEPKSIGNYVQSSTGLGIALTRLIVAMHQGELETRSKPNRHTTVRISFPESRIIS